MATIYPFLPSTNSAFSFQPTLDGQTYTIVVMWNVFGQRYYVQCYTLVGALVFSLPLIGSSNGITLQNLSWDYNTSTVTATTSVPHNFDVGDPIDITIVNCSPDAYNGQFTATVTGTNTFTYPMSSYPGSPVSIGSVEYNINIAAGYFTSSTLVYRSANQQFEVSP